mmetsp:Transcript_11691/g.25078  ORF Transcript_11691/g.25078 Transcript_11691/m.25078 type:complete len:82 (+) Transcript_11691:964-1209(+)
MLHDVEFHFGPTCTSLDTNEISTRAIRTRLGAKERNKFVSACSIYILALERYTMKTFLLEQNSAESIHGSLFESVYFTSKV